MSVGWMKAVKQSGPAFVIHDCVVYVEKEEEREKERENRSNRLRQEYIRKSMQHT